MVGEIAGGLLLGPTVLGRLSPETYQWLFPPSGPITSARTAIACVGMIFFIVTIGLDISVGEFRRIGRKALFVGMIGTLVPLALGFVMCYAFPDVDLPPVMAPFIRVALPVPEPSYPLVQAIQPGQFATRNAGQTLAVVDPIAQCPTPTPSFTCGVVRDRSPDRPPALRR